MALAAVAVVTGLLLRRSKPERAQTLLVVGLIPGLMAGMVFFWFPPFWLVSIVSLTLIVRIARDDAETVRV